jgi:uncharacterized protein YidB (DUF937 family)
VGIEDLVGAALKVGGGQAGIMRAVTGLIAGRGLAGLVSKLSDSGLGDAVNSWVGKGENASVSPDQMKQALGDDTVRQVAEEAGVSEGEAAGGLAELLPKVVDQLTPDGEVPGGDDLAGALGKLKGMLG